MTITINIPGNDPKELAQAEARLDWILGAVVVLMQAIGRFLHVELPPPPA